METVRRLKRANIYLSLSCWIVCWSEVHFAYTADNPVVGEIVNRTQTTQVEKTITAMRINAVPEMALFGGDTVITNEHGWAAILLSDETLVQINRNTVFVLKKIAPSAGWMKAGNASTIPQSSKQTSLYRLNSGEGWFRNKNRNMRINIETPTVTAGIRGTEINVKVTPDKKVGITVLEGKVFAENKYGSVSGGSGELITVNPGEPPHKTFLIQPDNAVQWTVTIPVGLERYLETLAVVHPKLLYLIQSRKLIEAEKVIDQVISDSPEDAVAWSWLALIRLVRGKSVPALEAAEQSVRLSPDEISSLIILSYCYQGAFDLDKGKATLETILNKDPDNVPTLVNLARLMFGSNETEQAAIVIDRAFEETPGDPDLLVLKGFLALAMQEYNRVESSFYKAIETDPRMGEAYMGLAIFHMRQGKTDLALKEIAKAVLLEPRRSVFVSYWAKMLYQIKRFDRTIELLDLAESLDPHDPTPHLYKSIVYRDLNYSGKAIDELNQAIKLNDNRAVYRSGSIMPVLREHLKLFPTTRRLTRHTFPQIISKTKLFLWDLSH